MSRYEDLGHYEVGNVFIQLHSDNIAQGNVGRKQTAEHVAKRVASRRATLQAQGRTV